MYDGTEMARVCFYVSRVHKILCREELPSRAHEIHEKHTRAT
jgi:hypothetical protein